MVNSKICTAQKMKFSIKDFFTFTDFTFTEEIRNGKLHFLCSDLDENVLCS